MLGLQSLIDTGLRRVETGALGVFNRIVDGRINATVLVTGSSRALNHYDPREITKRAGVSAWNIGVNGSQTDMQLATLQSYLAHNSPPQLLIHNLDSFTFVTSKDGVAFPGWYVPYLDEAPIYETLRRYDPQWVKAKYVPLYGYAVQDARFGWLLAPGALLGWNAREVRFNGFEPRATAWNEDFERFRRANPDGVSFPIEPEAVQDLEQLITEVTSRGGRVVLAYSPVYSEMQKLDRKRPELFALFHDIARRHGALLWDYSDSALSGQKELFYNSQHLNATGAALFSKDVAERVVKSGALSR